MIERCLASQRHLLHPMQEGLMLSNWLSLLQAWSDAAISSGLSSDFKVSSNIDNLLLSG